MNDITSSPSLLASLQRALLGEVHPALRQASIEADDVSKDVRLKFEYDGAAAGAQFGAVPVHAGGDRRNVRDFAATEAEGIAGALRLRLGAVSEGLGRGHRAEGGRNGQGQDGLAQGLGESGGHDRLLLAPQWGR